MVEIPLNLVNRVNMLSQAEATGCKGTFDLIASLRAGSREAQKDTVWP